MRPDYKKSPTFKNMENHKRLAALKQMADAPVHHSHTKVGLVPSPEVQMNTQQRPVYQNNGIDLTGAQMWS